MTTFCRVDLLLAKSRSRMLPPLVGLSRSHPLVERGLPFLPMDCQGRVVEKHYRWTK